MLGCRRGNKGAKCFGNFNLRHPSKNAAGVVRWSIARVHPHYSGVRIYTYCTPLLLLHHTVVSDLMFGDCHRHPRNGYNRNCIRIIIFLFLPSVVRPRCCLFRWVNCIFFFNNFLSAERECYIYPGRYERIIRHT